MLDLTGQRFGKLIVIKRTEQRQNGSVVWECQCDCGNSVMVNSARLRNGQTASCGCLRKEKSRKASKKDLTGQRFGRLIALKPMEERKNGYIAWECQCDCGNSVMVNGAHLRNGQTVSCGCLQKERVSETNAKDLTGQRFGRLIALKPMEERKKGYIVWECQCDCGNSAMVNGARLRSGRTASCGCLQKERTRKTKMKDLTGQRFGRLVAMSPIAERKNKHMMWECKCDCGNMTHVTADNLTRGITRSCGCLRKEKSRKGPKKDLTGQRFGRLIALKPMEERKNGYIVWECRCDCGNTSQIRGSSLLSGAVLSCGCLRRERMTQKHTAE